MNIELRQEVPTADTTDCSATELQQLRVLFVTTPARMGAWLVEAFADDCQAQVILDEVVGTADGYDRIHAETYDAVIVAHDDERLNAFDIVLAADEAAYEGPLLIVGSHPEAELDAVCYESGADAYLCLANATPRTLMWTISRTMELAELRRENDALKAASSELNGEDGDGARRLVAEQLAMFNAMDASETFGHGDMAADDDYAEALRQHYRDLLKAYIMMGSGSLTSDIDRLAESMLDRRVSSRDIARLHFRVVDETIRGLGSRSTRHVMERAGLLSLEILSRLGDRYRERYLDCIRRPKQLELPI